MSLALEFKPFKRKRKHKKEEFNNNKKKNLTNITENNINITNELKEELLNKR